MIVREDGECVLSRSRCQIIHPALLPPDFPILMLDQNGNELKRFGDPVMLKIQSEEEARSMRSVLFVPG